MVKSADAFRTISEVADWLETPAHVLRFWESKFSQVKPVKRAGGRRYYRPQDMKLLGGIKKLLHDDGMTIKGVQKLLREQGIRHVAALSQPLAGDVDEVFETVEASQPVVAEPAAAPAQVLDFLRREPARPDAQAGPAPQADPEPAPEPAPELDGAPEAEAEPAATAEPPETPEPVASAPTPAARLPGFLSRPPLASGPEAPPPEPEPVPEPAPEPEPEPVPEQEPEPEPEPEPELAPPPAPAQIEVPPDPGDGDLAAPGLLSAIAALPRPLPATAAEALRPLIARLRAAHDKPGQD